MTNKDRLDWTFSSSQSTLLGRLLFLTAQVQKLFHPIILEEPPSPPPQVCLETQWGKNNTDITHIHSEALHSPSSYLSTAPASPDSAERSNSYLDFFVPTKKIWFIMVHLVHLENPQKIHRGQNLKNSCYEDSRLPVKQAGKYIRPKWLSDKIGSAPEDPSNAAQTKNMI